MDSSPTNEISEVRLIKVYLRFPLDPNLDFELERDLDLELIPELGGLRVCDDTRVPSFLV